MGILTMEQKAGQILQTNEYRVEGKPLEFCVVRRLKWGEEVDVKRNLGRKPEKRRGLSIPSVGKRGVECEAIQADIIFGRGGGTPMVQPEIGGGKVVGSSAKRDGIIGNHAVTLRYFGEQPEVAMIQAPVDVGTALAREQVYLHVTQRDGRPAVMVANIGGGPIVLTDSGVMLRGNGGSSPVANHLLKPGQGAEIRDPGNLVVVCPGRYNPATGEMLQTVALHVQGMSSGSDGSSHISFKLEADGLEEYKRLNGK